MNITSSTRGSPRCPKRNKSWLCQTMSSLKEQKAKLESSVLQMSKKTESAEALLMPLQKGTDHVCRKIQELSNMWKDGRLKPTNNKNVDLALFNGIVHYIRQWLRLFVGNMNRISATCFSTLPFSLCIL